MQELGLFHKSDNDYPLVLDGPLCLRQQYQLPSGQSLKQYPRRLRKVHLGSSDGSFIELAAHQRCGDNA
jgi:hypothetical protein